jgi:hypothetical protein
MRRRQPLCHDSVMGKSLAIVLAIVVLACGTSRAATACDIFGSRGDCTCGPGSSRFDPIGCRLAALLDKNRTIVGRDRLWAALDRASGNAWDRVFAAYGWCARGRTNPTRRHLRRATTLLASYVARLGGPAAQAIPPDARESLLSEGGAIAAQVAALRARLDCPRDAYP